MFKRLMIAAVVFAVACAPAISAEQVKGQVAPAEAPATQAAQSSNNAVVNKSLTTATVTVPASSEPQTFEIPTREIMDALLPYITAAVGGVITVLGGLIAAWLKQRWNIDIDQKHRDAWQQAAQNAAGALLARGAVSVEQSGKVSVNSEAMANVVNTVLSRVPGAIKHFGFEPDDVRNLIVAKIPQVMTGSVPAAVAPAPDVAGAMAANA